MPIRSRPAALRLLAALAALPVLAALGAAAAAVSLTHIHGLAYSADGKRLFVPSHHGLAVYAGGRWSKAPGPEHDYMGFTATRDGFYSSGHPARGSGLTNPFGLMRSGDGGKTWRKLGLEGEADFHLLAASHGSRAVYVFNETPNSRMPRPGLYFTRDDGFSWRNPRAAGLEGEAAALAVHPSDPQVVAVATDAGLYLSTDGGEAFRATASGRTLSVYFDLDGQHLWYGGYVTAPLLTRLEWRNGTPTAVPLPALGEDAVSFIAQNPVRQREYAIATFERNVFVSEDGGRSWTPVAREGQGVDQ